ncbi:MAG: DUF2924 domain-containing protein [Magnetospiraceae bacterium]
MLDQDILDPENRETSAVQLGKQERLKRGPDTAARFETLSDLDHSAVRAEWHRLYRTHPPKRVGREVLILGIAWKIQEKAYGGYSAAHKRQIASLSTSMAQDGDLAKIRAVHLKPGAKLIREWNGETHDVLVVEEGFLWKGKTWRSLSKIAREITGTRWSGPRFFGLVNTGTKKAASPDNQEKTDAAEL